jgi:hypothetical protein
MTTFIIVFTILAMLTVASLGFAAIRHMLTVDTYNNSVYSKQSVTKILTLEEINAVKRYAAIFGVGNDSHEIDNIQLLELGQKVKGLIGDEKVEELVELVQSGEPLRNYVVLSTNDMRSEHHRMNKMLNACELITVPSFVVINEIRGGDRGGEEAISTHRAA